MNENTQPQAAEQAAPVRELEADVLVVGFGKAGKTIAMTRAKAGDRVILVERSAEMFGGTCINIGCVPTKTLLVQGKRFHEATTAREAADATANADAAFAAATKHRAAFVGKLNAANLKLAEDAGVTVLVGAAIFTGKRTVEVRGGEDRVIVRGETVIINTGAVPVVPPIEGVDHPAVMDSTAIQQLPERPKRLAVIGGGPIGLEFATMFAQFGSEVTVLDGSDTFLPRYDRDIAEAVRGDLEGRGNLSVITSAKVSRIHGEGTATVEFSVDGATRSVEADAVLLATGRRPATDGLHLEAAGVELNDRGAVVVDEHRRTTAEHVYAAGDVTGGPQFTYVSFDDHRVILSDRWGDGSRTADDRVIPTTTFLEPPLSQVGMGEEEAQEHTHSNGHRLGVRVKNIADIPIMPRPKILGQPEGRAKFLVDEDADRILGATLYCVDSQELINLVALAIQHGIPASAVGGGIYTHPSSSEVFNALLS